MAGKKEIGLEIYQIVNSRSYRMIKCQLPRINPNMSEAYKKRPHDNKQRNCLYGEKKITRFLSHEEYSDYEHQKRPLDDYEIQIHCRQIVQKNISDKIRRAPR